MTAACSTCLCNNRTTFALCAAVRKRGTADTTAQFFLDLDLLPKPPCFNDLESVFSTPLTSKGTPVKLPVTDALYRQLVQSNSTLASVIESTSDNPAHALAESISVALRRSPACEPTDEITIAGKRST